MRLKFPAQLNAAPVECSASERRFFMSATRQNQYAAIGEKPIADDPNNTRLFINWRRR